VKNVLFAVLIFLNACSSWKQGDFQKSIDKSDQEVQPEVDADKSLLKKFEIQSVQEKPKTELDKAPQGKAISVRPKLGPIKMPARLDQKKKDAAVKQVEAPKEIKPEFPKDYPENLKAVNQAASKVWAVYSPNHIVDQKIYLDIHYLGMTVGKIMFTNKGKKMINGKEAWHFHARFKSAPFYSNIYELDDTVDTYVTTDQFLSTRYSLIQRESKQDIDDLQLHDRDQLKTFWFFKQKKSNGDIKNKQDENFIPYFSVDPFSVVFFYQGLPLKDGDVYEIPLVNKGKILFFHSTVEGRETLATAKGKRQAVRVHATTQYSGEHLKSGDLYFWFSDDEQRILLKARAKIKIGSVTADIVDD